MEYEQKTEDENRKDEADERLTRRAVEEEEEEDGDDEKGRGKRRRRKKKRWKCERKKEMEHRRRMRRRRYMGKEQARRTYKMTIGSEFAASAEVHEMGIKIESEVMSFSQRHSQ